MPRRRQDIGLYWGEFDFREGPEPWKTLYPESIYYKEETRGKKPIEAKPENVIHGPTLNKGKLFPCDAQAGFRHFAKQEN